MLIDISCAKRGGDDGSSSSSLCKDESVVRVTFSLFGVYWVIPSSVQDTLLGWHVSFIAKDRRRVWDVGPLCIFWVFWKVRNDVVLRDEVLSLQNVKVFFCMVRMNRDKLKL